MSPTQQRAIAAVDSDESFESGREFTFSDADFQSLTRIAYDYAGIALTSSKRNLVYSRLARRLRALRLRSFRQYRELLANDPSEIESFINAISTNHTKFFRESHHFDHLRVNLAAAFARNPSQHCGGRLRVWSAGCSTGEEPYSIALVLAREISNFERYDIRILATDIDTDVLTKASRGEYPPSAIDDIPTAYRTLLESTDRNTHVAVADRVRSLIAFRRLNLMEPWPFSGLFDAIFCRNVMIYFDAPTKTALVERFTRQIRPGGWLYIGHSESLIGSHPGLRLVGRTIYRRDT